MSWAFVAHRGSANNKTSGNTIDVSPTQDLPAGAVIVVRCVADNIATTSGESSDHSVVASDLQVFTKIKEWTKSSGAAADGVTGSIWIRKLTATIPTSGFIRLSLTSPVTAKAIALEEFSSPAGISIEGAAGASGSSTTPSVSLAGLSSREYLWLGHVGIEGPNGDTFTQDTDYANNTSIGTTGAAAASNVASRWGSRVATLTGDTYNPTLGTSRDWVAMLGAVKETAQTYDETGKLQVVLAAQGKSDVQAMSETVKAQTILVVQGELDGFLFSETGLTQVVLALQGKIDQAVLSEIGKLTPVLVAQGNADIIQMNELAKLEVALAAQGEQDFVNLLELGKEEVVLVKENQNDLLSLNELSRLQVILATQGRADSYIMGESGKEQTILVAQGETDWLSGGGETQGAANVAIKLIMIGAI